MASLPHPSGTRASLTTLVAELYGDQSTPVLPRPADDHTTDERWQDAVTQVGEQLRATLRVAALPERLHKALALVLAHAVILHPDGTASVQSNKQTYHLAPGCPCDDAAYRPAFCKHTLAVELHRRALAVLDGTMPTPVHSTTSSAGAAPAEDTRHDRLPSVDGWAVMEAPASCCLRLRVGALELLYTMQDISDATLTSRVHYLLPWMQDLLDQVRGLQSPHDARHQQRDTVSASDTIAPHALSTPTPPSWGHGPATATGATRVCHLHQVAMALRSNVRGSWYSHWLASEQRYCKGYA